MDKDKTYTEDQVTEMLEAQTESLTLVTPSEPEESPTLVTLTKPFKFEGKTYTEIDLSGLENMSASDMCAAEKHLNRSGMFSPLPEMTAEYVCYIAAQTSDFPIEFFKALPPRDFIRVKNKVTNFFYGED